MSKFSKIIREEVSGIHLSLLIVQAVMMFLPVYVGSRLRTRLFRLSGVRIGEGTVIWGKLSLAGMGAFTKQIFIGNNCWINADCYFELAGEIRIGDRVSIGQQVMILTNSHEIGNHARRAGHLHAQPVEICNGAWLSTRCTILPGITVGEGAIVAAGAVVTRSVPPHVMVGGVPARIIRELTPGDELDLAQEVIATTVQCSNGLTLIPEVLSR